MNIIRHIITINRPYNQQDKSLGLLLMIVAHITLLLGLYQYFAGDHGFNLIREYGMGEAMKISSVRFWAVEHIGGMLLAIILITIARGVFRKPIGEKAKHTRALVLYIIALILIVAVIPWPGREGVGRPMFPGME